MFPFFVNFFNLLLVIHTASKKIRDQILQEHNDAVCILKKVVTDIGHFEVQGVTFQRNGGGVNTKIYWPP